MTRFTLLSWVLAYGSSWFRWSPADLGPAQLLLMWTRWSSCCVFITHGHLDVVLPTLPASVPHNHLLTSLDQGFILFGHECDEAISISTSDVNSRQSLRTNKDRSLLFWMNLAFYDWLQWKRIQHWLWRSISLAKPTEWWRVSEWIWTNVSLGWI